MLNTAPPAKQHEPMVVFGGDAQIHLHDQKPVTFGVMCEMMFTTDDRGTISATRPLYEWPLLKATYARRGGSGVIADTWLYHPKTGVPMQPREVPLSRHVLMAEQARCEKNYVYMLASGKQSIFEKTYGVGITNRFVKVVNDQARAWNGLKQKMLNENRFKPTLVELEAIAAIADPMTPGEIDIEEIPIFGTPTDAGFGGTVVDLGDDLAGELQGFLVEKGHDPMTAASVAQLYNTKQLNAASLSQLSELHQKPQALREITSDFNAWEASKKKPA